MKRITAIIALSFCCYQSIAQQTRYLNNPNQRFEQAKEYFQKEEYSLAYPLLKEIQQTMNEGDRSNQALSYQELRYYAIVCALKQNEERAVYQAQEFIDLEDNAARVQMMNFHLSEYYFQKQDYAKAITGYEAVNLSNLSNDEISDLKFHLGYSYFTVQRFDQAEPLLNTIRTDSKNRNYMAANYYYGYVNFYQKNYKEALPAFKIVEDHPEYGKLAPYFIATIYYTQGNKQQALEYAQARLKKGGQHYEQELRQLAGHALFEQQQYDKAVPLLESYVAKSKKVRREDIYELSYSYYKAGKMTQAIDGFKQLSGKEDSLSQNAMYMLGDAYLKTGQKANARNAFLFCSSNSSNTKQREISLFNYAKLSYELGYQDVALSAFEEFLTTYPTSTYTTEAREIAIGVLANTNNYKYALQLVDSIKNPSPSVKQLLPKVLYGRATELINDGMLVSADELLTRAEHLPDNRSVLPFVQFWKGEINYRLNKPDQAIPYFYEYLKSSAVNGEVNPVSARYNLGYLYLRKENYRQALGFFEQVVTNPKINASPLEQDAYLRIADCYYMNRDFKRAQSMYDKVLDYSWPSSDYATFQKGMISGINSGKEKIALLTSISRKFPQSELIPDANMEVSNTYLSNEQFREAVPFLKNVISDPNSALKPRAHLNLGIAYYNLDNNKEALNQYTTLLKQYPNSTEGQEALENAKAIFVEEGRTAEYVDFARSMGQEVSTSQADQLAYEEAEVQFNNGNFPAAAKKFEEYLTKFPDGKHSLDALYYKSEIYFNQKDLPKAVAGYETLADRVPHKFGERSLLQAARINFFDLKDYAKAEKYFTRLKDFASNQESRLEAMRGLLRSQYQLKNWKDAVENAKDLLSQKGIGTDDKVMANMAIAKSYQENNQCDLAITNFRTVASLSKAAYGAEARYEIANCLFIQNRIPDAEKAAFEVINKSGSYEFWVTKSYILLGDIYFKQKDYFNSKATFQSVLDNAKIEELRQEAQRKLNEVVSEEQKNSKVDSN